jgi:hypothetical protein
MYHWFLAHTIGIFLQINALFYDLRLIVVVWLKEVTVHLVPSNQEGLRKVLPSGPPIKQSKMDLSF